MSLQDLIYTFTASFIALFPVMNPIGNGFIINGFLENTDQDHRRIYSKKIVYGAMAIGLGSLAAGHLILLIFGLAIPVIQVGGGLLICKTGLDWLSESQTQSAADKQQEVNNLEADNMQKRLFYPLTFPISIGPGSMSVIFTLMATSASSGRLLYTSLNYLMIALAIAVLCLILYAFLVQGSLITKKLGKSGNLIINKLVAFITFCIGIQILVNGISRIFHIQVL